MYSLHLARFLACVVFVAILAWNDLLTSPRPWLVSAEATKPSAEFIAAAMRNQEQPGMALVATYTLESGGVFGEGTRVEVMTVRDRYYVRTLKAMYLEEKVTKTAAAGADTSNLDITNYTVKYSYNRTNGEYRQLTEYADGRPSFGIDTHNPEPNALGLMTTVESVVGYVGSASLYHLVKSGTVLEKTEIDGHNCWGVAYDVPGVSQRHVVWVDPDIGFCPRRIELILKNQLRYRHNLREYREIGKGVWFPKEIISEKLDKTGKLESSSTIKVTDAELVPIDPDIKLRVRFPSGTLVLQ